MTYTQSGPETYQPRILLQTDETVDKIANFGFGKRLYDFLSVFAFYPDKRCLADDIREKMWSRAVNKIGERHGIDNLVDSVFFAVMDPRGHAKGFIGRYAGVGLTITGDWETPYATKLVEFAKNILIAGDKPGVIILPERDHERFLGILDESGVEYTLN